MRKCKNSIRWIESAAEFSILFCLILSLTAPGLHGAGRNWIDKGGIEGTFVTGIAVDPSAAQTLYACIHTGGSLFKSTDGGSHWGHPSLNAPRAYTIAIDPVSTQTIYAGEYAGGAYKSTDGGASWAVIVQGVKVS